MTDTMTSPKLTKLQRVALLEIHRYTQRGLRYFWRIATMRSLVPLGYVEEIASREFRLTAAGHVRAAELLS